MVAQPEAPAPLATGRTMIRVRGLAVATVAGAILAVAAWLTPDPSGSGTHEQLGLPACRSIQYTRWPCPTCGLTTATSATVHGQLGLAWRSQPFGIVFALALVLWGVAGIVQVCTGRSVLRRLGRARWWIVAVAVGLLAGWGLRVLMGLMDGSLRPC